MAISLQADSTLPQGYILVDGQRAATVTTAGLSGLVDNSVTSGKIVNSAVTNDKLSLAANAGEIKKAINADNSPPIFACRAWVNFDGTKDTTGAASTANTNRLILASGNVASVTKNATGDFTINFDTAMSDANYSAGVLCQRSGGSFPFMGWGLHRSSPKTSGAVRIETWTEDDYAAIDPSIVDVHVFR
jgi:hypothetical protein